METDPDFDALLNVVKSGSTFEALRAATHVAEIARKRRQAEVERSIADSGDFDADKLSAYEYRVLRNTLADLRSKDLEVTPTAEDATQK